jgi:hypothetical protein
MNVQTVYFWSGLISEAVFLVGFAIYGCVSLYNRNRRHKRRIDNTIGELRERYYEQAADIAGLKRFVHYVPAEDMEDRD